MSTADPRTLTDLLACPVDHHAPLEFIPIHAPGHETGAGIYLCEECGRWFPVEDDIASLLPDDLRSPAELSLLDAAGSQVPEAVRRDGRPFNLATPRRRAMTGDEAAQRMLEELAARDAQVTLYDQLLDSPLLEVVEVIPTVDALQPGPGDRILEIGCGTGRLTRHLAARAAWVVACDLSRASLIACRSKSRGGGRLSLVQADATHLPFRDGAFEKSLSAEVLEHVPTPATRAAFVAEASRTLAPGGRFVLTAYHYSLLMRLVGRREGIHEGPGGGIYYRRFTVREMQSLLAAQFPAFTLQGLRNLPGRTVERWLGPSVGAPLAALERRLSCTPLSRLTGHLLLAVADTKKR